MMGEDEKEQYITNNRISVPEEAPFSAVVKYVAEEVFIYLFLKEIMLYFFSLR